MRSDPGHLGAVAHIADTVRRRHQIGREESHCQPFRLTVRDRPWTRAESAQSRLSGHEVKFRDAAAVHIGAIWSAEAAAVEPWCTGHPSYR